MKFFNGLTTVNVELTSRCNKNCWMCGRRKMDREYPEIALKYGDMDFDLAKKIAKQLPDGIIVQLHNNGEPLLYPKFGAAAKLFKRQIICTDTNGKLLVEKAKEIIDNLDTLTVSVIENDTDGEDQYKLVKKFLKLKGGKKPFMVYRCLGNVDAQRYKKLEGLVVTRTLHNPMGSFKYKKNPTIPEAGICLDALNHMAINRFGKVSLCVRFDPLGKGIIGDANKKSLLDIWNNPIRKKWLQLHKEGKRKHIPLCQNCEFWGVPTAY